jgi:phosphoglycerate dehydrogenase-like enzyme
MRYTVLVPMHATEIRDTFLTPEVAEYLEANFDVIYNTLGRKFTANEYKKALMDADLILGGWGTLPLTADLLEGNKRCRMLAYTGGSVADATCPELWEMGFKVSCGNELFAESVAEAVIGYMILALRSIYDDISCVRAGGWHDEGIKITRGLFDREIGIVGCGAVARYLMSLLRFFRCSFKVAADYSVDSEFLKSMNARQVSIEEVFSTCEIVSLHLAQTPETRGIIGRELFESMPKNAVFINTARGSIIRENEMAEVLDKRRDIQAVLDVFEREPLDADSPLRSLPNVYSVPHRGGPTVDRRSYITKAMIDELIRFVNGEPLKYEISKAAASRMTTVKK